MPVKKMPQPEVVSVRFSVKQMKILDDLADALGVPVAELIRQACTWYASHPRWWRATNE